MITEHEHDMNTKHEHELLKESSNRGQFCKDDIKL